MALLKVVMLGIVLYLPQSWQLQEHIILDQNVTGILGEELYLRCLYTGIDSIIFSSWNRLDSTKTGFHSKRMAGYKHDGTPFNKNNFHVPASRSNLTVKVTIDHLNMEGQYSCMFFTEDNDIKESMFLTVLARPNVSTYVEEEVLNGTHYQSVSCLASNAKPMPFLTWEILGAPLDEDFFSNHTTISTLPDGTASVVSVLRFPIYLNNESSVMCVVEHPAFTEPSTTEITLQTYGLTSLHLADSSIDLHKSTSDLFVLNEGDSDIYISMNVTGNVPRYKIDCTKDGEPLPKEMTVVDSNLIIKGPVGLNLSGHYQCQASYYRHTASLQFDIKVNPIVSLPGTVTFPPNISVNLRKEENHVYIECLASDASPAANISWVLPHDLKKTIQSNITSSYGTHSVKSFLILPACLSKELTIECMVEHSALTEPETRLIVLPACIPGYITMNFSTFWDNGMAYTELICTADNVTSEATVSWHTENCTRGIGSSEFWLLKKPGVIWNTARLSVLSYAGCTVICVVEQMGLEDPVKKRIQIPLIGLPMSRVVLGPQKESTSWAAVCDYQGSGVIPNISWVIFDASNVALPSRIYTTINGIQVQVRSTYTFLLNQHEGKSLVCVIHNAHGKDERRTIRVPKYFISSVVVLNKTILHGNQRQHNSVKRIALKEHVPNQRILFKIIGNAPASNLKCFRPNGLPAHTVGMALVFANSVSELDAGLYTCNASCYHHEATVFVQVDVTISEAQNMILILICFCSASAIAIVLLVTLCIFCKRSEKTLLSVKDRKKRESLADLMQDPRSPELKKAEGKGLLHYSIVIDVKSTV